MLGHGTGYPSLSFGIRFRRKRDIEIGSCRFRSGGQAGRGVNSIHDCFCMRFFSIALDMP